MRRECWERFPRHRLKRKTLGSDPGMHYGTCMAHVPWCMPGSLTRGGGENVPGIPGALRNPQFCVSGKRPIVSTDIWQHQPYQMNIHQLITCLTNWHVFGVIQTSTNHDLRWSQFQWCDWYEMLCICKKRYWTEMCINLWRSYKWYLIKHDAIVRFRILISEREKNPGRMIHFCVENISLNTERKILTY